MRYCAHKKVVAPQRGNFSINPHGTTAVTNVHTLLKGAKKLQALTIAIAREDGVSDDGGSYLRRRKAEQKSGQQMFNALTGVR
jgi:hypothetical protein